MVKREGFKKGSHGLSQVGPKKWMEVLINGPEAGGKITAPNFEKHQGLADTYFAKGDYKKALDELTKLTRIVPKSSINWCNCGAVLTYLQRYSDAINHCDKAIELDSGYFPAWITKGNALRCADRFGEALECLDKAIELNPKYYESWYIRGLIFYESERLEDATKCFEKAVELAPEYMPAWRDRGDVLRRLQRFEEALSCLKRAIELNPHDANNWYAYGSLLNDLNRFDESLDCFTKATEIEPRASAWWYWRGMALCRLQRYPEALECLDEAIKLNPGPGSPNLWYVRGLILNDMDRLEDAIKCFDKVIKLKPDDSSAWHMKGIILGASDRHTDAIECFEKAIQLDPENHKAWAERGSSFALIERHEEAFTCYDKATKLDPDNSEYWFGCGALLTMLNRFVEALDCFNKAVELKLEDCELWLWKASTLLMMLEKDSEALDCLGKATTLHPKEYSLWYLKGITLERLGRYSEAFDCFGKAAELQPKDFRIWHSWGKLLYSQERYSEALECLDKAVKLNPNSFFSWILREEALVNTHKAKEGVESFEKATWLSPNNFRSLLCRATVLDRQKDFEEALEHLDNWLKQSPDNPYVWWHRGVALFHLNRSEESLACFDKVIEMKFYVPGVWCYRGMAQINLNRYEQALRSFSTECRLAPGNWQPWFYSGNAFFFMLDYQSAMSDFRRASRLAAKKSMHKEKELCEGFYCWALAMDSYMKNNYKKAKGHFSKASEYFEKRNAQPLERLMELFLQSIELDDEIKALAYPKNIKSLKVNVERIHKRMRTLCESYGIKSVKKVANPPFFAKNLILELFHQALEKNVLDENLLNQVREIFELFPSSEWITVLDDIIVLLREISTFKTAEDMGQNEDRILRLTKKLEQANRHATGEGLKLASRNSGLLERERSKTELENQLERIEASMGRLMKIKEEKEPDQINIRFTTTEVNVEGKNPLKRRELLRLAEYIIFKKEVHWLWAYVILQEFNPCKGDPDWQFRNYVSSAKVILKEHGIHIRTSKKRHQDGTGVFKNIDDNVISDIGGLVDLYKRARRIYEEGKDTLEAIKILSEITKFTYVWYTFTDAYMDLAKWICQENFKGVSDELIRHCKDFLTWYIRKLKIGIERINDYIEKNRRGKESPLSTDAEKEFKVIKEEFKKAKSFYIVLIKKQPLTSKEEEYEKLIEVLLKFQEEAKILKERSEKETFVSDEEVEPKKTKIDYVHMIVTTIKLLCKEYRALEEVIENGYRAIDKLPRRSEYTGNQIRDMREDLFWQLGEVVLSIESFDEFDQITDVKLVVLKNRLSHSLERKVKQYAEGIKPGKK